MTGIELRKIVLAFLACLAWAGIGRPSAALAQVTLQRIIGTGDSLPDQPSVPVTDITTVAMGNGQILAAVKGSSASGFYLFTSDGAYVRTVVDTSIPVEPEETFNYNIFSEGVVCPSGVVIRGGYGGFPVAVAEGVYSDLGGSFGIVADQFTLVPGGFGLDFSKSGFDAIDSDGTSIVFIGREVSQLPEGVYRSDGSLLQTVVDQNVDLPGPVAGFKFAHYNDVAVLGDTVTFVGSGIEPGFPDASLAGVYQKSGTLDVVADYTTPLPNLGGNFGGFGLVAVSDGCVVFTGGLDSGDVAEPTIRGVYRKCGGGNVEVIADVATTMPDGGGNFEVFPVMSASDSLVAFGGGRLSGTPVVGVYAHIAGALMKVLDNTDTLDGADVESATIFRHSADDDTLGIRVLFTNGEIAAYVATLPVSNCTPGDVDGDSGVTIDDVANFVTVLLDPDSATEQERCASDVNQDTIVNGRDIEAIVALLAS